jgi:hypothetical protein
MGNSLIFDFDGTLTQLSVNWQALRNALGLEKLSDYWSLSVDEQSSASVEISRAELLGLTNKPLIDLKILQNCRSWSVITNNCESTVLAFLERESIANKPSMILGRESLKGPKEDFKIFEGAVRLISELSNTSEQVYFGDSEYEIEYCSVLGIQAHKVPPHDLSFLGL